jgi:hypothetical protein
MRNTHHTRSKIGGEERREREKRLPESSQLQLLKEPC